MTTPVAIGVDIGTTTITSLALDLATGNVLAKNTRQNECETTSTDDRKNGRSEWDADRILQTALRCIAATVEQAQLAEVAIIGVTGQQHGGLIVDDQRRPLTPLIGWQDRRTVEEIAGRSTIDDIRDVAGDSYKLTGCRMVPGFLGATMVWLQRQDALPEGVGTFITDLFCSTITDTPIVTDPTNAGGSGLFDVANTTWLEPLIADLGLKTKAFPAIATAGDLQGTITSSAAEATGIRAGTPVAVALGDHQAAFVGSVRDRQDTFLVNVGTGGQVAGYTPTFAFDDQLETRPFPRGGYSLVSPGLCGGRTYAALDQFFRDVATNIFGIEAVAPAYETMNRAAKATAAGTDGMRFSPLLTGTRLNPSLRGSIEGMTPTNLTAGHLTRALLEGMAGVYADSARRIAAAAGHEYSQLVGSGNGLRENTLLTEMVSARFGCALRFPRHTEEAAVGAALTAAVGAGVFADLEEAIKRVESGTREK